MISKTVKTCVRLIGSSVVTAFYFILVSSKPAASQTTFVCGTYQGRPATIAQRAGRGSAVLVQWRTNVFGGEWTPQRRCQHVTSKFNDLIGRYRYIVPGTRNGYNVVCASNSRSSSSSSIPCSSSRTIMTLPPGMEPENALRQLVRISSLSGTTGPILNNDQAFEEASDGGYIIDTQSLLGSNQPPLVNPQDSGFFEYGGS